MGISPGATFPASRVMCSVTDCLGHFWKADLGHFSQPLKHNHNVGIQRLCKSAQDRLNAMKQYDPDEILSLRLSGTERVWGILADGICTLVWWDPEHQVCPSDVD